MTERGRRNLLTIALWVCLFSTLFFGVLAFFVPEFTVKTLAEAPAFDY